MKETGECGKGKQTEREIDRGREKEFNMGQEERENDSSEK